MRNRKDKGWLHLGLFCGSEGVEEIEEKALRAEKAEGSEARP